METPKNPGFNWLMLITKKPDNRFDTPKTALAPGEVGFGYLMNGKSAFNSEGNPARPILCAPLAYDRKTISPRQFDRKPFDGRAIFLRIDNSATSVLIRKGSNKATMGGGKTLLQTGPDTAWGGDTPTIVPPLPRP